MQEKAISPEESAFWEAMIMLGSLAMENEARA